MNGFYRIKRIKNLNRIKKVIGVWKDLFGICATAYSAMIKAKS